jgi:hypothetical protein
MVKKHCAKPTASWTAHPQQCPLGFAKCLPGPERLVALGFRYWMRGRVEANLSHWERAWNLYAGTLGVDGAKCAVASLSRWIDAVGSAGGRDIEVFPEDCCSYCRDECIAVSIIAACQHNTSCPALRACAFALLETSTLDGMVSEAQAFAETMIRFDQVLSPRSIVVAPMTAPAVSPLMQ